mmetsp:Transcript_6032/g.14725  ORF Transcript_6032/g.14725 Transcript_6032/m.14725 type:complete len:320 (-) Transcript_6032:707-1666(-)
MGGGVLGRGRIGGGGHARCLALPPFRLCGVFVDKVVEGRCHVLLHRVRHIRVEDHNRAEVASLAAVVARRKHRDEAAIMAILEAAQTLWNLVRPDAEREGVVPEEAPGDIRPEPDAVLPAVCCLGDAVEVPGVGPHAVEQQRVLDRVRGGGALAAAVEGAEVLDEHRVAPEQPPVHHEYLLLHHRRDRQHLEELGEHHKDVRVVLRLHLVEEAAAVVSPAAVHLDVLVVAAVDGHVRGVQLLVHQRDHQDFHRVFAAIGNVSVEEIPVLRRRLAVLLQHPEEVSQLSVRVSTDHQLPVRRVRNSHVIHGVLEEFVEEVD